MIEVTPITIDWVFHSFFVSFWRHVKLGEFNAAFLSCDAVCVINEAKAFSYKESASLIGYGCL